MNKPTFKKIKIVTPRVMATIRKRMNQCPSKQGRMLAYGRMINARHGINLTSTK